MHLLLLLALLQAAPAAQTGEPLRSGCSAGDDQIASVSATDRIEIESALAGEGQTCYHVRVARGGETLNGYILGDSLPAIKAFVQHRELISEETSEAEACRARQPKPAAPKKPGETVKPADPLVSTKFSDFTARDSKGKMVSLSELNGKVTVVTFWSPSNPRTIPQLTEMMPLYNELHKSGLAAVGVSMDPKLDHITQALDDITLPWPQVADQAGLAARYQIDPKAGKTIVLDASHRVVAAGPMGPDIVKAVHELMNAPESQ